MEKKTKSISQYLWDLWCLFSIIGIWPRFIEPNLIRNVKLNFTIANLPQDFKLVQFSDLHFSQETSERFLEKLKRKILSESPDIIVFTGDFLCYANFEQGERLKKFLNSLHAKYGCFAVLGNHDYDRFVSVNEKGEYDVADISSSTLSKGFKRLFSKTKLTNTVTDQAKNASFNQDLMNLLKETPIQVLHNETTLINIGATRLNLLGLGEFSMGKCDPEKAFKTFDSSFPGIILSHHPDSLTLLKNYPGDLILSGHTHGGQVNLPFMRKKFISLQNDKLSYGLVQDEGKKIYITRGIGSVMKFRWFAMPEILSLTVRKGKK